MKKLNKDNKGFSLVELLVVIAIMVVLVGVIAPTLLGNIEKARVSSDIQSLDSIAAALQDALGTESAYTKAMATYTAPTKVSTVIGSTVKDTDDYTKVVNEYLSSVPAMKGTKASKVSANLYFCITTDGKVTVWLSNAEWASGTAAPTDATSGAENTALVYDKSTNYIVTR